MLELLSIVPNRRPKQALCRCSCGSVVYVLLKNYLSKSTTSCGCSKVRRMNDALNNFDSLSSNLALVGELLRVPMTTYDRDKHSPSVWTIKHDGYCLNIYRTRSGRVVAFTRNGTDLTDKLMTLAPELLRPFFTDVANDTFCIGEIHTGTTSKDVASALAGNSAPKLQLTIFRVHSLRYDLPRSKAWCDIRGLDFVKYGAYDKNNELGTLPYPMQALPVGVEGYVLLNLTALKQALYKYKPKKTIDLVVTGFETGKGKYSKAIGALICSAYTGPTSKYVTVCKVASGLTDGMRFADPATFLGRVVEVSYDSVSVNSLRFPRLERFRDDKPVRECTLLQDKELWDKLKG